MVGWFVCQQDYTKATKQIYTKLGWWKGLGPEETTLTFGVDLDEGTGPRTSFLAKLNSFFLHFH